MEIWKEPIKQKPQNMVEKTKLEVPIPQKKVDNPECKEIVEKEKREVKEKVEEGEEFLQQEKAQLEIQTRKDRFQ